MANPRLRSPKTLDVDDKMAYAVLTETWRVLRFFLYRLKRVEIADLESDDRDCSICREPFDGRSHGSIQLPCKHCFGESCIKLWLSPYAPCEPKPGEILEREPGANNCPICRRVFFRKQTIWDTLPEIEARLRLLDQAYEHVGIELTERQSRARHDVMSFVHNYPGRSIDRYFPPPHSEDFHTADAHSALVKICGKFRRQQLTPRQEELCRKLEVIAIYGFGPLIDIDNEEGRDDKCCYDSHEESDEFTEEDVAEIRLVEESNELTEEDFVEIRLDEESDELTEGDLVETRLDEESDELTEEDVVETRLDEESDEESDELAEGGTEEMIHF